MSETRLEEPARRGDVVADNPRTEQGHTFLTKEEKAKLRERAAALGMSQSAYLRYLVVNDFGPLGASNSSDRSGKEKTA